MHVNPTTIYRPIEDCGQREPALLSLVGRFLLIMKQEISERVEFAKSKNKTGKVPRTFEQLVLFFNLSYKKIFRGYKTRCWEWSSTRSNRGYGMISHTRNIHIKAHRLLWVIRNGEIKNGLLVCHRCDNPPCVNPSHLFLGTHQDNALDAVKKGIFNALKGEAAGRAKLSERDVKIIRKVHSLGVAGYRKLGKRFGVDRTSIRCIIKKKSWKHI